MLKRKFMFIRKRIYGHYAYAEGIYAYLTHEARGLSRGLSRAPSANCQDDGVAELRGTNRRPPGRVAMARPDSGVTPRGELQTCAPSWAPVTF